MNNHMEAAIKAGAFAINPYPFQGRFEALGRIQIGHGETWDEAVQREKRSAEHKAEEAITAALPHIRAMVAEEIRGALKNFEFDLRLASADREGYYYTRWDRAIKITVTAQTEKEAARKAAKALGDPRRTGTWASDPYWVYRCDAVREVTQIAEGK